jgi:2-polyprenyl-6-methoxyphenol hydroxylase-like FAD-dependent oxidoreductase
MVTDHGVPYYHVHRADYQAMLHRLVRAAPGVRTRLGSTVRDVQPNPAVAGGPSVTLASGEVLHADLIVGADGVKSTMQKAVTGLDDKPTPTGDAAYRVIVHTDLMLADPELRPFVETPEMTAWMAPDRHLVGYCIVSIFSTAALLEARREFFLLFFRGNVRELVGSHSEQRRSTTSCYSTPTMDPSSRGRKKAAETRCAQILRILSHGT